MKLLLTFAMVLLLSLSAHGSRFLGGEGEKQPIVEAGAGNSDNLFAASAADGGPARPPGYRNAWDDCGGVGASATERMRTIAAGIKGWAKPLPFVRNAAQDCGGTDMAGTKPGPATMAVYPGPEITRAADDGLAKASKTLDKYGPTEPPPARQSIYAASALQEEKQPIVEALASAAHAMNLRSKPEPKKEEPHFLSMEWGPFESREDACDACFNGFTKKQVVPHCQCYAYDGDGGPDAFCTMSPHAAEWIAEKDPPGCMCHAGEALGEGKMAGTTCKPFS